MKHDFVTVHDLYQNAILRYCMRNSHDTELGQDLSQETFYRFWLCLERNDTIEHVRAFLYRIALNLIVDHYRKKRETSLDQLRDAGFEPSVDLWHQTYSRLDAERPQRALRKMQEPYRQTLHQHLILGLHPREIAAITGESSNVISVRIFRGLKHLRSSLGVGSSGIVKDSQSVTASHASMRRHKSTV